MANKERGEMRLIAGEQEYVLFLTLNAACDLEDRSGKTFEELQTALTRRGSLTALRWLLWGALQHYHGAAIKTPQDAGKIIEAAGGISGLIDQMTAFITLNEPPESELIAATGNGSGTSRPPDDAGSASGAIGNGSISTPVN
jgi:hypothetical protein